MAEKILAFIFGSAVGSFLNVCIYRLPKDLSIVKPASFCPNCNKPVCWYDNIPILSFFILRGRCRHCKNKIALRYPIVEFFTALMFLLIYNKLGLTAGFFKYACFFSLLIVVSFIDIEYRAIPAYLCFIGIIVGLVFSVKETGDYLRSHFYELTNAPLVKSLYALIFGLGFSYLFKFFGDIFLSVYLALRKKESIEGETEALGLGDVDFMGMVGVFMGVKAVVLVFFIAPVIALLYAAFALIFKKSHLLPYLPYLSLAAVTVFFWGQNILRLFFWL